MGYFFSDTIYCRQNETIICTKSKVLKVKPNIVENWGKKIVYTSQIQKKSNLRYCAISKNSKTWQCVTTEKNSNIVNTNMK